MRKMRHWDWIFQIYGQKAKSIRFELIQHQPVGTDFLFSFLFPTKHNGHNGKLWELLGSMAREYSKETAMSFLSFEKPIGASYALLIVFYSYIFILWFFLNLWSNLRTSLLIKIIQVEIAQFNKLLGTAYMM